MPEIMADLLTLIEQEVPEGRQNLQDSHTNLEKVAEYCEANYFQSENKRVALEETKNYTTQSLASVAYQINTLAYNLLHMLDLQTTQMAEMESQINHIAQTVMIHKEKVARREIGILTTNKSTARQHKILAPANPERPIKYIRKPIDYSVLDDVGHGLRASGNTPRLRRTPSQFSAAILNPEGPIMNGSSLATAGPAPTTKPPTPPQTVRSVGSLSRGSREYRTPAPPIAPPTVPSNYAPNYPLGHPRSQEARRGSGYSTLPPMHHSHHHQGIAQPGHLHHPHQQQLLHHQVGHQTSTMQHHSSHHHSQYQQHHSHLQQHMPLQAQQMPPQIGMVHPLTHQSNTLVNLPLAPTPPPPPDISTIPSRDSLPDPPPPPLSPLSPMSILDYERSVSPPLPPPPPEEEQAVYQADPRHYPPPSPPGFARARSNSEHDTTPKNYIEKVVAIYDYHADKEDELSFSENSVIFVVKKNDDGWYEGVLDGVTGLFPGNYVEPCL